MKKEEHWKLNKTGHFEGVYAVDPTKGKFGDRWARVGAAIESWAKLHPQEFAEHCLAVEYERQAQMNAYASTKDKSLRWGCSIPVGLGRMLELIEPELFTDPKLGQKFMKKFPIFNVCQKV